jgi:hypothetical protein
MKQFKFDDEQIVIDKYLPHNFWPKNDIKLSTNKF